MKSFPAKYLAALTVMLTVSACSTLYPDVAGVDVYYFESRLPEGCKKLGELEATANSMMDADAAKAAALTKLRKMAAETYQANAVVLDENGEYFVSASNTGYAKATAYDCPR